MTNDLEIHLIELLKPRTKNNANVAATQLWKCISNEFEQIFIFLETVPDDIQSELQCFTNSSRPTSLGRLVKDLHPKIWIYLHFHFWNNLQRKGHIKIFTLKVIFTPYQNQFKLVYIDPNFSKFNALWRRPIFVKVRRWNNKTSIF